MNNTISSKPEGRDKDLLSKLYKWAATRTDEVVLNPKDGYYSFDIVADAHQHGVDLGYKQGQEAIKQQLRNKFIETLNCSTEAITNFFKALESKSYKPKKVFINHSFLGSTFIITVDDALSVDREFLLFVYNLIADIQDDYRKRDCNIDISVLADNENLDQNIIKSDGFDFGFDIENNSSIE